MNGVAMNRPGERATGIRWPRLLAIALGAVALASCRSVTSPLAGGAAGIVHHDGAGPASRCGATCRRECRPEDRPPCPPLAVVAPPPVPVARVCKVCDGGDSGRRAKPSGDTGIDNLTSGDTVARFRGSDDAGGVAETTGVEAGDGGIDRPAADRPQREPVECDHVSVANCACVCAPRFASVREIVRPRENHAPTGPIAASLGAGPDVAAIRQKSRAGTQRVPPVLARRALPELAVVDARPTLGLEEARLPGETPYVCVPAEDVQGDTPQMFRDRQRPKIAVAFDVPLAWMSLAQAQVKVQETAAETIAVDRGTAVLRLKCPGRAELSLCKRAGGTTVRSGEELDFTIAILNSGDRKLEGIVLADALPKRLAYVPDSADSTLPADFGTETAADGAVVLKWVFKQPLAPGESGFVRFRTLVR